MIIGIDESLIEVTWVTNKFQPIKMFQICLQNEYVKEMKGQLGYGSLQSSSGYFWTLPCSFCPKHILFELKKVNYCDDFIIKYLYLSIS